MADHPTCSSTEDGPCPSSPLAGVDTCLRHTGRGAPVQLGRLIPTAYVDIMSMTGEVRTIAVDLPTPGEHR